MVDWSKINNFWPHEFYCSCCGEEIMDESFIVKLDVARGFAGVSFSVTSGYRCKAHNRGVGSKDTSSHPLGLAADIKAAGSRDRFIIVAALIKAGFTRIGVGKEFVHVDNDNAKAINVMWLY